MSNILIVEDEDAMRELLIEHLAHVGITSVLEAATVEEAIAVLESKAVQMIISDYAMPGRHGGDLLRYVYEKNLALQFIMFTSSLKLDLPKLDGNFLGIIEKPNLARLTDLVEINYFKK